MTTKQKLVQSIARITEHRETRFDKTTWEEIVNKGLLLIESNNPTLELTSATTETELVASLAAYDVATKDNTNKIIILYKNILSEGSILSVSPDGDVIYYILKQHPEFKRYGYAIKLHDPLAFLTK